MHDLKKEPLIVGEGFVAINERVAEIAEGGADVAILELDGCFRTIVQLRKQGAPVIGLAVRHLAQFSQEHRQIVAYGQFQPLRATSLRSTHARLVTKLDMTPKRPRLAERSQ